MKLDAWLRKATQDLANNDIPTARLDCLVRLEDVLGKDRAYLLAHPEIELTQKQEALLDSFVEQRKKHIPLSYIRNKTEFYGREFYIDNAVLEPRPETETMIDLIKTYAENKGRVAVCDLGTGSGAIGITLAMELSTSTVDLVDIEPSALSVATKNARKHGLDPAIRKSDLLQSCPFSYDIIAANLPYVPDAHKINKAAENEPNVALFGGMDGLDVYRKLFKQLQESSLRPAVFTESLPFQHCQLEDIARNTGYKLVNSEDFIQQFERTE
ncbi:MAG TPA: peptide chain release factor N(5)-glutamine methyltransferase [Candidatus Saccharibacteria bacterium]|nr:peptide chain release factor N(5)-glutamine methyltransferase [Candidatus Saccharibacteria bacterium]